MTTDSKPTAEECWRAIDAKTPPGAKALIVAQLTKDESDPMTDYFGESIQREVAIGWRFTDRENFKRLRQVAATFPETAHLGPDCDDYRVVCKYTEDRTENGRANWTGSYFPSAHLHGETFARRTEAEAAIEQNRDEALLDCTRYDIEHNSVEHRENYSMGKGNYLESRPNAWRVKSYPLAPWVRGYRFEDHLPQLGAPPELDTTPANVAGVTVTENERLDGVEVRFGAKPSEQIRDRLKAARFHWSRRSGCWYKRRSQAAVQFAQTLAHELNGTTATETPSDGRDEALAAHTDVDRLYEDACASRVQ